MKKKLMALLLAVAVVGMYSFGSVASVFAETTDEPGASEEVSVTINNPERTTLSFGESETLTATVTGADSSEVKWSSSNKTLLTVDESTGKITANNTVADNNTGDVTVTAAVAGKTATCKITVTDLGSTVACKYYVHFVTDLTKINFDNCVKNGCSSSNYVAKSESLNGTVAIPSSWVAGDNNSVNRYYYNTTKAGDSIASLTTLSVPTVYSNESEIKDLFAANGKTVESAKAVVWYVIKHHSDGYHVDGYVLTKISNLSLSYNANGGTESSMPAADTTKYETGNTATLSATVPTREGYDFVGWSTNKDAKSKDECIKNVTFDSSDITVYAIWAPKSTKYTVKANYYTNGQKDNAEAITLLDSADTKVGSSLTATEDLVAEGSVFDNKTYKFTSSDTKITAVLDASKNVVTLRYDRTTTTVTPDDPIVIPVPSVNTTTYKVVANYYTSTDGGAYVQDNSSVVTLKDATSVNVGDTISAADFSGSNSYNGNSYGLDESKSTMSAVAVLDADSNVLTLNYYRSINGGSSNDPSNNNSNGNNSNNGSSSNTADNNNSNGNSSSSGSASATASNMNANVPDTGDTSDAALWTSIGLTSLVLAGAMISLRRKEEK